MNLTHLTIVLGISIPFFAATVWAIVDAGMRDFGSMGQKALWMLVAAIPFVGFPVYLLFGLRRGNRPGKGKNID